jgi:hypothetical protein
MARGSDRGDGSARGAGAQKAKGQGEKQNQGPGIRNQESGNYLQLAIYLGCFKRPDLAGSSTAALTHRRHRLHRPLCISTNYIPTTHTTHDTRHDTRTRPVHSRPNVSFAVGSLRVARRGTSGTSTAPQPEAGAEVKMRYMSNMLHACSTHGRQAPNAGIHF